MIVTCVFHEDRRPIEAHAGRAFEKVNHCTTHDDLWDRVSSDAVRTVVADLDVWPEGGSREIMRRMEARRDPVALFLVHTLTPRALRELEFFARTDLDVRPAYRRYHCLEQRLDQRGAGGVPCATMLILRRLVPRLGVDAAHLVVCSSVLGERRTTWKLVAAALGLGVKNLRTKWKAAGLPKFERLMAKVRIAHAIYRMETFGVSTGEAAACAGFSGQRSLENYVKKHTDLTPHQLVEHGGFERVVREIEEWFPAPPGA